MSDLSGGPVGLGRGKALEGIAGVRGWHIFLCGGRK